MELGIKVAQNYLGSNCTPFPDKHTPICPSYSLFAKVPRNNASMRSSLMACNTLRCLTLFKNTMNDDDHSKDAPNYDLHLFTLKLIHDDEINDWKIKFHYTLYNGEGLIDEIKFLSCKRHENSELLEKDWTLLSDQAQNVK